MSPDVLTQLADYGAFHEERQDAIEVRELAWLREAVRPLPFDDTPAAGKPSRRGWLIAAAAAIVVLVLVGGAIWLVGGISEPEIAEQPTTTIVDERPAPPSTTIVDAPPPPELDIESIPLPVIARDVTPSSIGPASWTVYEGMWTQELEAGLEAAARSSTTDDPVLPEPILPESILSVDGIVVDAGSNFLGAANGLALHSWGFGVDWVETAVLHGGEELRIAAENGRVEAVDGAAGEVDILLFASEDARFNYFYELDSTDDVTFDTIARYQFSTVENEGRWTLEAVDASTGERIGSFTSAFPFVGGESVEGIVTLSEGDSVDLVEPDWLEGAALHGFNWFHVDVDDSFVVYAESDESTYTGWRSTDGRTWENLGPPFPVGYVPQGGIVGDGDDWIAYLDDASSSNPPGPDFMHAFSSDGLNWVILEDLPAICGQIFKLQLGWVCISVPNDQYTLDVWTSPDGVAWNEVTTTELPSPADLIASGTGGSIRVGDNTIVIQMTTEAQPESRLWVVRFG